MAKLGVVIFNDDYFSHEGLAAFKWASDYLPESKQLSPKKGRESKLPQLVRILLVKEVDEQSQTAVGRKSEDTSSRSEVAKENSQNARTDSKKIKKKGGRKSEDTSSSSNVAIVTTAMKIEKGKEFTKDHLIGMLNAIGKNKEDWIDKFNDYMNKFDTEDFLGYCYKGSYIHEILEEAIKDFQLDTLVLGMAAVGSTRTGRIDLQLNSKCSVVFAMTDPETLKKTFKISATPADDGASKTLEGIAAKK